MSLLSSGSLRKLLTKSLKSRLQGCSWCFILLGVCSHESVGAAVPKRGCEACCPSRPTSVAAGLNCFQRHVEAGREHVNVFPGPGAQ